LQKNANQTVGNFFSPKPYGLDEGMGLDQMRRGLRFWVGSDREGSPVLLSYL